MYATAHKNTTAKEAIKERLKGDYPSVFAGAELQRMEFRNKDGTVASPAVISRRLRELEEEKLIAVRYENKRHAHYRYLQEQERENYIPTSERDKEYSNNCWKDPSRVNELKYKVEGEVVDGVYKLRKVAV